MYFFIFYKSACPVPATCLNRNRINTGKTVCLLSYFIEFMKRHRKQHPHLSALVWFPDAFITLLSQQLLLRGPLCSSWFAPQAFKPTYLPSIMQDDSFIYWQHNNAFIEMSWDAHLLLSRGIVGVCDWMSVRASGLCVKSNVSCRSTLPEALPPLGWFICNSTLLLIDQC